jgi:3-methyladenine DNA glycosylase/8-oxoguanine DNA glycosylase
MSDVVTAVDYKRARRLLMSRDPVLGAIIRANGPCGLAEVQRDDPFHALVEAIVSQQLSSKAAATIFDRFVALFPGRGFPAPDAILGASLESLRGAGLSRQKTGYIHDLCRRILDGSLRLGALGRMDDEAVIKALTEVRGIGRWTAEMFLMFTLHRPDVLPVDDLGIVKAVQRAYGLRKPPRPDRIRGIGEAWRPYRSVASWYLWASLDNT